MAFGLLTLDLETAADHCLKWVDDHRWWLLGGIVILYVLGFNGQWHVNPDSARYANAARGLVHGQSFTDLDMALIRYPGLTWLMAVVFRVAGEESGFLVLQMIMLGLSLSTLALTFAIFRLHNSRAVAVMVTCLLAINLEYYRHAYHALSNLPFLFGLMLFLLGYELAIVRLSKSGIHKLRIIVASTLLMVVGLAIAVTMRRTIYIFVAAVIATTAWQMLRQMRSRRRSAFMLNLTILLIATVVLAGFLLLIDPRGKNAVANDLMIPIFQNHTPGELAIRFRDQLVEMLEHKTPAAMFGIRFAPVLNSISAIAVLGLGIALMRHRRLWGIYIAFMVIAMIIHMSSKRYFISMIPLFVYAWWCGAVWFNQRFKKPWGDVALIFMLVLWCVPNTIKIVDTIFEQRRLDFLAHYRHGDYKSRKQMAAVIEATASPNDLILAEEGPVYQFYSRRPVISSRQFQIWRIRERQQNASGIIERHMEQAPALYVVQPFDKDLNRWVHQKLQLRIGPAIEQVRDEINQKHLSLHRAFLPVQVLDAGGSNSDRPP